MWKVGAGVGVAGVSGYCLGNANQLNENREFLDVRMGMTQKSAIAGKRVHPSEKTRRTFDKLVLKRTIDECQHVKSLLLARDGILPGLEGVVQDVRFKQNACSELSNKIRESQSELNELKKMDPIKNIRRMKRGELEKEYAELLKEKNGVVDYLFHRNSLLLEVLGAAEDVIDRSCLDNGRFSNVLESIQCEDSKQKGEGVC